MMKRFIAPLCMVTILGVFAHSWGQDKAGPESGIPIPRVVEVQGDLMECSPPKFLLVSKVDVEAGTISGFSTVKPKSAVLMFSLSIEIANVELTNSKRMPIGDDQLEKLEGKLVVMTEGKKGLSAAYLGLLRDDTVVMSVLPPKEKKKS